MKKKQILLYGASGHSKVICSILESMNINVFGIFDDYKPLGNLNDYKVIGKYLNSYKTDLKIIISIGDNKTRENISKKVTHSFGTAIHISSKVDDLVKIDEGSVIFHNTTIQRDTQIGKHCIINTNASIDHECILEDYVQVSPSATLCGNIHVGKGTFIGANATILPNLIIGKWCVIGAGAVVTKDIPDYSMVVGNPGKIIKNLGKSD